MNFHLFRLRQFSQTATGLLGALLFLAYGVSIAPAQGVVVDMDSAPPPLRFIPNEDKAQLDVARDGKTRTRLSLELAEARLQQAEKLTGERKYDRAATEIGVYQALVEDTLRFLNSSSAEQKKFRSLYKRLELTLRAHDARVQALRRATPAVYGVNIQTTSEALRRVRTNALNAFFGEGTINDSADEPEDEKDENSKNSDSSASSNNSSPLTSNKDQ